MLLRLSSVMDGKYLHLYCTKVCKGTCNFMVVYFTIVNSKSTSVYALENSVILAQACETVV